MSTDQYPGASGDDAYPQNAPRSEWPKKIRTLSAADLDRLTIDSEGRFYWDGHLVNYQPHQPPQPAPAHSDQPVDLDALALLDRAARELSGQPVTEPVAEPTAAPPVPPPAVPEPPAPPLAGHEPAPTAAVAAPAVELHAATTQPAVPAAPIPAATAVATVSEVPQVAPIPMFEMPSRARNEKMRVRMSFWQSLALLLVIIALLIGAAGIAISGLVAAHDWGCRTKLINQYCPPPPPVPKPPPRVDIPA